MSNNQKYVEEICFFLLEATGNVNGKYEGYIPSAQQRKLFGRVLCKRGSKLFIDGAIERIFVAPNTNNTDKPLFELCTTISFRGL